MRIGQRVSWRWCEHTLTGTVIGVGILLTVQPDDTTHGKTLLRPDEATPIG